jgi:peptide deformylase
MAIRPILIYPDPLLKQVAAPVAADDATVSGLIQDLVDTMTAAGHSVGVAATQIGDLRRVVVVDVSASKLGRQQQNHGLLEMVNPVILERSGSRVFREGCMSVPDYTGNVTRAEHIVVEFVDRNGRLRVVEASGFEAVAIQHELDHLDGQLFLDRVSSLKTDLFRRRPARPPRDHPAPFSNLLFFRLGLDSRPTRRFRAVSVVYEVADAFLLHTADLPAVASPDCDPGRGENCGSPAAGPPGQAGRHPFDHRAAARPDRQGTQTAQRPEQQPAEDRAETCPHPVSRATHSTGSQKRTPAGNQDGNSGGEPAC